MRAAPMNGAAQASAVTAAGRLFRAYGQHVQGPTPDTLFGILTAMHSLNDRLRAAAGRDLHSIEEFVALKALRNFAHHQEEVSANVRLVPTPAYSDLAQMCLVRRDQVERAIEGTEPRWRDQTRAACVAKFHWYGQAVNINPCLFNFVVRAYELLRELGVQPPAADVAPLEASYRMEEEQGHSHYVDGGLTAPLGQIEGLLSEMVAGLPPTPA